MAPIVVDGFATRGAAPTEQGQVHATAERLAAYATCSGSTPATAVANAHAEARREFERIRPVAPKTWQQIANMIRERDRLDQEAASLCESTAAAANSLEAEIMLRANLRAERADLQAKLDTAKSALASPDSLDRGDAELVRLRLEEEHLPAKVVELDKQVAESTAKIEAAFEGSGWDRQAFLADILKRARGSGHYPDAPEVLRRHSQGYLTL